MTMDLTRHIGAVTRTVEDRIQDGRPARVVVAARSYDTTVDDLWDALTNKERLPRWFAPVSGDLRLGGRYQIEGNAGGTITRCEPPTAVGLTWEFAGAISWVEVRLRPEGKARAHLTLEHIAYPDEHWVQYGPGATGVGWDMALAGLAKHLETGASNDPKAAAAWFASEDAKQFVRRSSADWKRADVASGTDEAVAEAAANRTHDAYTAVPPSQDAPTGSEAAG